MAVSPQLQQGIINLLYFTWLHNADMIAYFMGSLISLGLLLKKPKRTYVILLMGFIFLMIQFQYVKHIVEPLMEQTFQAVLETGAQATRFQLITRFLMEKLIPFGLYITGWGSIFLSILLMANAPKHSKKKSIDSNTPQNE